MMGVVTDGNKLPCAENPRRVSAEATTEKDGTKEAANNIAAQTFTFRELAAAAKNFRQECLVGEGGFGRVYKGRLGKTGQVLSTKYVGSIFSFLHFSFHLELHALPSNSDCSCEAT